MLTHVLSQHGYSRPRDILCRSSTSSINQETAYNQGESRKSEERSWNAESSSARPRNRNQEVHPSVKACYQLPVFALGKPRSETDRSDFPASPAVFTDYLRQVTVSRNQSRIATPRHCQDTARIKTGARSSTQWNYCRQLRGLNSSSQRQCNQYIPQIQLFDNRTLFYPCT